MMAIDLFCGLGGWSDGLLAEGWEVIGFDIEQHAYGEHRYPAQLVLQDVLTLHGSQFRGVDLIVASPPCQEFSYMAMPWSIAKEKARKYEAGELDRADLTRLFDACFRIQREACEAAGRHIPLIVENVRGAQPWVGRSPWNYGSFHLWGDVPALMPMTMRGVKTPGRNLSRDAEKKWGPQKVTNRNPVHEHVKAGPAYRGDCSGWGVAQCTGSGSKARKAASAMIAKIPLPLARYIGRTFKP